MHHHRCRGVDRRLLCPAHCPSYHPPCTSTAVLQQLTHQPAPAHRTSRTTLSIILSPVGPYFKSGLKAISLYIDDGNVRAWPGGVGQFKIGGNYAPTIVPQVRHMEACRCVDVTSRRHACMHSSSFLVLLSRWTLAEVLPLVAICWPGWPPYQAALCQSRLQHPAPYTATRTTHDKPANLGLTPASPGPAPAPAHAAPHPAAPPGTSLPAGAGSARPRLLPGHLHPACRRRPRGRRAVRVWLHERVPGAGRTGGPGAGHAAAGWHHLAWSDEGQHTEAGDGVRAALGQAGGGCTLCAWATAAAG